MIPFLLAQGLNLSIVAGGIASLGSQDSYNLSPTVSIDVSAHTSDRVYSPDLKVKVDLSNLPEENIDLSDATTFKSLEFEVGLAQAIPGVFPKLYAGFGIATRLPGETEPRVNAAKYFTAGIRFSTSDSESYLYVGAGSDQRLNLDGLYSGVIHINGKLKLAEYGQGKLSLAGNAILGGQSSLVRIGIVVGI